MSTTLIIIIAVCVALVIFIGVVVYLSNKYGKVPKIENKNLNDELDVDPNQELVIQDFTKSEKIEKEDDYKPVVSESYVPPKSIFQNQEEEKPFDFEAFYKQTGSSNDDDYDSFQKDHSYHKYLTSTVLAETIKGLPEEVKVLLVSDVLKKKDYFNDEY